MARPEDADDEPEYELYDHHEDPLNLSDVAGDHPEIVERLAAALARWQRQSDTARLPADDEVAAAMTPDELRQLRSLGYLR